MSDIEVVCGTLLMRLFAPKSEALLESGTLGGQARQGRIVIAQSWPR